MSPGVVLEDGTIAEMVFDQRERSSGFVVGRGDEWEIAAEVALPGGAVLCPYSPGNNLLTHGVVALPSRPMSYGTEQQLIDKVGAFLHRYVDLTDGFEELAARYVLFTWCYDDFSEVPYLRIRGDYGTGKSRFLLAVGLLCYRATFASGASSVSSLFRVIDAFRGTLLLDEGDFRFSDEKADVTKILNNGYSRGFPVLRTEQVGPTKEFSPRAFTVFGPKIIATRDVFQDRALESRCLTEVLHAKALRPSIPLNLNDGFRAEALELRNQLLAYRLRSMGMPRSVRPATPSGTEPRTEQILRPLLATIGDEASSQRVETFCRTLIETDKEERRDDAIEVPVLEALLAVATITGRVTVKAVAEEFSRRSGDENGWQATPRWIGSILRRKLYLRTVKSQGNFTVPKSELARLPDLARRYGIAPEVDVGTSGTSAEEPPGSRAPSA